MIRRFCDFCDSELMPPADQEAQSFTIEGSELAGKYELCLECWNSFRGDFLKRLQFRSGAAH